MSSGQIALIVAVVITIYLDWLLMQWLKKNKKGGDKKTVQKVDFQLSRFYSPIFKWVSNLNFELPLITLWALWVGRVYLNFDRNMVPGLGNDDFLLSIYPYFPFVRVLQCGDCFFWNGLLNGGSPTFGDSIGALLHPVMAAIMLLFGVTNGIKMAMLASLIMGGWSLWWIAKVLDLKPVTRLWVSALAVVGGHMAGPLYSGDVGIVFSTAATSLTIAPALALGLYGRRRDAIMFGLMLAQAILAGQGYLQLALFSCVIPAMLIFGMNRYLQVTKIWKEIALAIVIAVLIASVVLIPWFTFGSQISRPTEPRSDQPMEYMPMNLLIRDMNFFLEESLEKIAAPNLYVMYIGWIPILLAIAAWRIVPQEKLRLYLFFIASIALIFFLGSGAPLRWAKDFLPGFLRDIRNPNFGVGLAVTLILGLAALGLDQILSLKWPAVSIFNTATKKNQLIDFRWVLAPILLWSITSVYQFNDQFRYLQFWPKELVRSAESIPTKPAQWVRPVYGNWTFVAAAVRHNVKITDAFRIWEMVNRPNPPMSLDSGNDPAMVNDPNYLKTVDGVSFVLYPQTFYAFVDTGDEQIPCEAIADGGHVQVTCDNAKAGDLTVYENAMRGWRVWRDGKSAALEEGQWLKVSAPAGKHIYIFRYWPGDVIGGFLLTLIGLGLSYWLWNQNQLDSTPSATE